MNYKARRQRAIQRQILNSPPMREPSTPDPQPARVTPKPKAPVCDRSGDIGSVHIFRDGAKHGDVCLCGKRAKYEFATCEGCGDRFPLHGLKELETDEGQVLVCEGCLREPDDPDREAYERAQASDEWQRRGGGGL